jgi:tetratricopeptide (TPR) repeat protein
MTSSNHSLKLTSSDQINHSSLWLIAATALCILVLAAAKAEANFALTGWKQDADGYRAAMTVAKGFNEPALIYYTKKNCGWCRRLNNSYFRNRAVASYLKNFSKVEIKSERQKKNAKLIERQQITDFPTLLVSVPAISKSKRNVSPFDRSRSLTPEEFIQHIEQQIASIYHEEAVKAFKNEELQLAESLLLKALERHRQSIPYLYQMAEVYDHWGKKTNLRSYKQKAISYYKRVLQLDTTHNLAKAALNRLKG